MSEDLKQDAKEETQGGIRAIHVVIAVLVICIILGCIAAYFLNKADQALP